MQILRTLPWDCTSFWLPSLGRQGGVPILISEKFQGKVLGWCRDTNVRIISLLIQIGSVKANIVNILTKLILREICSTLLLRRSSHNLLHCQWSPFLRQGFFSVIIGLSSGMVEHDLLWLISLRDVKI